MPAHRRPSLLGLTSLFHRSSTPSTQSRAKTSASIENETYSLSNSDIYPPATQDLFRAREPHRRSSFTSLKARFNASSSELHVSPLSAEGPQPSDMSNAPRRLTLLTSSITPPASYSSCSSNDVDSELVTPTSEESFTIPDPVPYRKASFARLRSLFSSSSATLHRYMDEEPQCTSSEDSFPRPELGPRHLTSMSRLTSLFSISSVALASSPSDSAPTNEESFPARSPRYRAPSRAASSFVSSSSSLFTHDSDADIQCPAEENSAGRPSPVTCSSKPTRLRKRRAQSVTRSELSASSVRLDEVSNRLTSSETPRAILLDDDPFSRLPISATQSTIAPSPSINPPTRKVAFKPLSQSDIHGLKWTALLDSLLPSNSLTVSQTTIGDSMNDLTERRRTPGRPSLLSLAHAGDEDELFSQKPVPDACISASYTVCAEPDPSGSRTISGEGNCASFLGLNTLQTLEELDEDEILRAASPETAPCTKAVRVRPLSLADSLASSLAAPEVESPVFDQTIMDRYPYPQRTLDVQYHDSAVNTYFDSLSCLPDSPLYNHFARPPSYC